MVSLLYKIKIWYINQETLFNIKLKRKYFQEKLNGFAEDLPTLREDFGRLNAIKQPSQENKEKLMQLNGKINEIQKIQEMVNTMTAEEKRATDYVAFLKENLWK